MKEETLVIARHQSPWRKKGAVKNLVVTVYKPGPRDTGEWACRIVVDFDSPHDHIIYGNDSYQSLKLAFGLVKTLVVKFAESGWVMADETADGSLHELSKDQTEECINAFF